MVVCSQCGQENAAGARFCNECAAPLTAPAPETRKTVTVVFCDLVGSTSLGDRTDPEVLRDLMSRYHGELRRRIEAHGGTVEKFIGDAAMAVFGIPLVHEDDALRAVRSAIAMREAVASLDLQVRIGVNTGEVVAGIGETLVTGDAVNVAARLEQHAETGQILIGPITERLVRGHIAVEPISPLLVKGKDEPLVAYRVAELPVPGAAAVVSPFVGRATELESVECAVRLAADKRTPQLVTIVGAPGIGKSRLVAETLARINGRILVGRCLSYGDAITYWPLVEILESVGDVDLAIDGNDAALVSVRLAAAMGTPGAVASPDEIAWAFRRLVESLSRDALLVVVFDDIHWAEATLLDLIEYVATFTQDAPVVLLCTARPDLFDVRPDWTTPRQNATLIRLEPLEMEQADALVNLLGDVPDHVRERIVDAADGNPLFVEQLVAMHEESSGDELEVPPNLQALLAARIDRLEGEERLVLERASVEGRLFHRGAVMELLPEPSRRDVGARLMALVRREFIRPDRATIAGEDGFRFGHILIRDAAYDSVPKRTRAELHEKYADWILERLGADAPPEIVGYHLEQAYAYKRELGESPDALGNRAANQLAKAAQAAESRSDAAATRKLYERATATVSDAALRAQLLVALAGALYEVGDTERSGDVSREATRIAEDIGDQQTAHLARIRSGFLHLHQTTEGGVAAAVREASAVIDEAGDDRLVLASAWRLVAHAHNIGSNFGAQMHALDVALEHARAIEHRQLEIELMNYWAAAVVYGPVPVEEGFRRVDEVVARLGDVPYVQALTLHVLGHLRARHGDFGGADYAVRTWREHMRELGRELQYASTAQCAWDILWLAGDYAAGEAALEEGREILEGLGEKAGCASHIAMLADAAYLQNRRDDAERLALMSRDRGSRDDAMNEALWRCVLAKVRAEQGAHEDAIRLAREGIEFAGQTDMLDFRAECYFDLAQVCAFGSDMDDARHAASEALALYRRKGNEVGVQRVQEFVESLEAAIPAE